MKGFADISGGTGKINTKQLAAMFLVEPNSVRTALSAKGHFWGLVPAKTPNGRLLWDLAEAERLLAKGRVAA